MSCATQNLSNAIQASGQGARLATIRDRFAAQVLDLMFCTFLSSLGMTLVPYNWTITIPFDGTLLRGTPAITAASVFVVVTFLYFLVWEAAASATPGKLLCRVSVRSRNGAHCSVAGALVRTVLRPIDVLIGPVLMALSAEVQRLGDKVADTTVVKIDSGPISEGTVAASSATWELRTKAALIDGVVVVAFTCAYLLAADSLISAKHSQVDLRGMALLVLIELLFLYFVTCEAVFGGTLGKLACNLRVVSEVGIGCGFSESAVRTVCRVSDLISIGLLPLLLVRYSPTRRHLGDRLAGTVVIDSLASHKVRRWMVCAVLCATGALALYSFINEGPDWPTLRVFLR